MLYSTPSNGRQESVSRSTNTILKELKVKAAKNPRNVIGLRERLPVK
jgi:hypothetical protein